MPDIENLQVIGISSGESQIEAFHNLVNQRSYLLSTSFDKIFSYRLASDYNECLICKYNCLKDPIAVAMPKTTSRISANSSKFLDFENP